MNAEIETVARTPASIAPASICQDRALAMVLDVPQLERLAARLNAAASSDIMIIGVGFEHGLATVVETFDELERFANTPGKRITGLTLISVEYERRVEVKLSARGQGNVSLKFDNLPQEACEVLVDDVVAILAERKPWYAAVWSHGGAGWVCFALPFAVAISLFTRALGESFLNRMLWSVVAGLALSFVWTQLRSLMRPMRVLVGAERLRRPKRRRRVATWVLGAIVLPLVLAGVYDCGKSLIVGW